MTSFVHDGFWLPAALREQILEDADWEILWLKGGALSGEEAEGAVAVRWPRLAADGWRRLRTGLQAARAVRSREAPARWGAALYATRERLVPMGNSPAVLPAIAAATGYSPAMLAAALWHGDLVNPSLLDAALDFWPTWSAATGWESMPGLPGRVRFFPARRGDRARAGLRRGALLARPAPPVDLALGYAAGNVPGTALLIALLAGLANFAGDAPAPAVLVRNSRHEPLFAPWVLSAIEAADPGLVAGVALVPWDYEDAALQGTLLRNVGLLIAAAGDDTIAALEAARARHAPYCRFHRHGHKVSFAVIGDPTPAAARLAALDSSLWDQNGCLSARIHFVTGDAEDYATRLVAQMRALAAELPRGTTPRRFVHRAFDAYVALASGSREGQVRVCSSYDDDFTVVVDRRPWDQEALVRAVNACAGRVVVVRQVANPLDVPGFLGWLPPANLQSASVAMPASQVFPFAEAVGACGVTAVRSLGRAAFPQLAYSWDGLLPLDLGCERPPGHFTTVEFEDPVEEMTASLERWGGSDATSAA